MKAKTVWNEKMIFTGESGGHSVELDTKRPIGTDTALTPKELVAIGLCGCTAMDVAALMKKHKQPVESFEVRVDAPVVEGAQAAVFKELALTFELKGNLDREKVLEAVRLSQTKYCAVSAMLVKSAPVHYQVILNGESIGSGEAHFE